jgi:hypothetical protein
VNGAASRSGVVLAFTLLATLVVWGSLSTALFWARLNQRLATAHLHAAVAEAALAHALQGVSHPWEGPKSETELGACRVQIEPRTQTPEATTLWVTATHKSARVQRIAVLRASD